MGRTPLHIAAEHGVSLEVVTDLLSACPEAAAEADDDRQIPLHRAVQAKARSLDAIALLLAANPLGLHVLVEDDSFADLVFAMVKNSPEAAYQSRDSHGRSAKARSSTALPLRSRGEWAGSELIRVLFPLLLRIWPRAGAGRACWRGSTS